MRMTQQQQQRDDQGQRDEKKEVTPARAERGEGNEKEAEELKADEDDDEDDDCFFESLDRVPSGISIDFDTPSTGSDSEDDVRVSFASAIAPPSDFRRTAAAMSSEEEEEDEDEGDEDDDGGVEDPGYDYDIWMAEPISIKERRRLLLQGMDLASGKDLSVRAVLHPTMCRFSRAATMKVDESQGPEAARPSPSPRLSPPAMARSRSDTQLKTRVAGSSYTRASSAPPVLDGRRGSQGTSWAVVGTEGGDQRAFAEGGELFTIKNLDTGKEFVVSEVGEDGKWGLLNDLQTGVQLTMEELDRFLGYSPIVKEVMRRANIGADRKSGSGASGLGAKTSSRGRGRRKGGWLKNIKVVASSVTGLIAEKERDNHWHSSSSSEWMKVHQHGKPYKELTGLYMCQEIQAHQGSIWSIKFSSDSRFLASAGEDRVVRVWQVLECDAFASSLRRHDTLSRTSSISLGARTSKRTRKGSSRRPLPDYIVIPETIFSLSDKPVCSFEGHLDDVLDLSWSKSRKLLSSSMDKTVRLWDMESKTCLRLFAHNDYVTCIQFNPIDDKYFISGSLDAKVRIWSIPDHQVVDWSDLHEMVTAACYTPDGQGALVGSHKGSCRFYKTSDSKLYQEGQIDIQNKKRKSHAKKITGFQFVPDNQSEVMITAADSQIRVFDGAKMVHKYRGFRNSSSQISASYSSDGKYVVCASEDSHVYIWKRDVMGNSSGAGGKGKTWVTTRSHEHFHCRDVSVAIPWPSSGSNCKSTSLPSWSRRHKMIYDEQHLGCSDSISLGDAFQSSRSPCPPPLPKKSASERSPPSDEELSKKTSASERSFASSEELRHRSRSGSGIRGSTLVSASSSSSSMWSGPLSSITASITSSSSLRSWGWHGGGSNRPSCGSIEDASAWGLVVVTAGLRGNIRIYQNFGLPIRLTRQTNLF